MSFVRLLRSHVHSARPIRSGERDRATCLHLLDALQVSTSDHPKSRAISRSLNLGLDPALQASKVRLWILCLTLVSKSSQRVGLSYTQTAFTHSSENSRCYLLVWERARPSPYFSLL